MTWHLQDVATQARHDDNAVPAMRGARSWARINQAMPVVMHGYVIAHSSLERVTHSQYTHPKPPGIDSPTIEDLHQLGRHDGVGAQGATTRHSVQPVAVAGQSVLASGLGSRR